MSANEVEDWMQYEREVEPLSNIRWDWAAAQLCATMANSMGNKTKVSDFLPDWARPPKQTAAEMWAKAVAVAQEYNRGRSR